MTETPARDQGAPRPRRRTGRRIFLALAILLVAAIAILFPKWRAATMNGGQRPATPFRIAGNLYYVGASDVSSFLVAGPEGHILIDGGYPGTAPMIMANVRALGFDMRDVKVLLNSEPHFDHAGGLAALQEASGAQLYASEASADAIAAGGNDPAMPLPIRLMIRTGIISYPAPRVDRRLRDGDTVRVGPLALVARVTPGHTRGCTSWTFTVQDAGRDLHVVSACSLVMLTMARYAGDSADFERTVRVLRSLPVDVWVTSHARLWGRYRKFVARDSTADKAAPFIDPAGYRAYLDSGEARFRREGAR